MPGTVFFKFKDFSRFQGPVGTMMIKNYHSGPICMFQLTFTCAIDTNIYNNLLITSPEGLQFNTIALKTCLISAMQNKQFDILSD